MKLTRALVKGRERRNREREIGGLAREWGT